MFRWTFAIFPAPSRASPLIASLFIFVSFSIQHDLWYLFLYFKQISERSIASYPDPDRPRLLVNFRQRMSLRDTVLFNVSLKNKSRVFLPIVCLPDHCSASPPQTIGAMAAVRECGRPESKWRNHTPSRNASEPCRRGEKDAFALSRTSGRRISRQLPRFCFWQIDCALDKGKERRERWFGAMSAHLKFIVEKETEKLTSNCLRRSFDWGLVRGWLQNSLWYDFTSYSFEAIYLIFEYRSRLFNYNLCLLSHSLLLYIFLFISPMLTLWPPICLSL